MIILKLTSRPSLSLLLCGMYLQYLGPMYFIENARIYVFLHDFTHEIHEKRTGWQPCSIIRDKIHCNKYLGTHRVMNVGYPGSKISTRFNPKTSTARRFSPNATSLRVRNIPHDDQLDTL